MPDTRSLLVDHLASALRELRVDLDAEPLMERSGRPEFGDWSTPAPLRLARVLRRPPLAIAEELRELLSSLPLELVEEWTVTPPGYVNARLRDAPWSAAVLDEALTLDRSQPLISPAPQRESPGRTLIEHTNINTNKAAHIGHLRNACIGDTVARVLRRAGQQVEVNNYIDDTGVQVADVVLGIRELGMQPRDDEPFDQFCSRVYVEVSRRHDSEATLIQRRQDILRAIERGDNEIAAYVKDLAIKVVRAHLATMARFDVHYDLLTWESDIIALGFWQHAFELLRQAEAIVYVDSGKNKGCWVLPAEDEDETKVLVKSDGVATYTAKDIAYQLWKFGLLGLDFSYRRWDDSDPRSPYTTTAERTSDGVARFGRADRVINVIDSRQAYLQGVVKRALAQLGYQRQSDNSIHLAYEVVALSSAAAHALGVESQGEGPVALSGRQGIEVRADDLLDLAISRISEKAEDVETAKSVAAGAVRYYLLKFSLNQIIAFDFDDALRTTGDTGVYLQYAYARVAGILRKVPDDDGDIAPPRKLEPSERELLHTIDGYRHAIASAAEALSPALLSDYAFSLASALSDFYEHTTPIVREMNTELRRFRRRLVGATRATLADALATLGMAAPERI
ncbi:MAG TPA: arginine--tRNA ligase [Candidatus Sulfotelmatobacter sp.]|nr:arginine--tRNA ligase [Candidatus Sulfotelmatobacter sp.]